MSSDYYPVLVEWTGPADKDHPGHGLVKFGAVDKLILHEPPFVLPVFEVRFVPGIHWFEVRDDCLHPRRAMTQPEVQSIYYWLDRIATALKLALTPEVKP